MSVYDELLDELETLAKAMPDADEGEENVTEPDGDEGAEGEGDNDGDEKPMAKAMTVTLESGEQAEAIDADMLIKSMQAIVDSTTEAAGKVFAKQTELLKSMGDDLKTLKAEITALKSEGRGRKSVVTMAGATTEEPIAKSMQTPSDVLAKCLDAQKAGKLTALDVSMAEGYLNRGMAIPARIIGAIS